MTLRVLGDLGEGSGVTFALGLIVLALTRRLAERQALRADLAFAPFIVPIMPLFGRRGITWHVGLRHRTAS